ncbi:MAG: hypothetical protein Q7R50_05885, partial [Dehalococcoidales bacterium]|nr:hypothetical protein [Dehalococcoidales bacterium]
QKGLQMRITSDNSKSPLVPLFQRGRVLPPLSREADSYVNIFTRHYTSSSPLRSFVSKVIPLPPDPSSFGGRTQGDKKRALLIQGHLEEKQCRDFHQASEAKL